jgi:polar amino acid transport system substrate-binding protein
MLCLVGISVALTGCGNIKASATGTSSSTKGSQDSGAPAALVPSSIRSTGTLVIGTNIPFPPMEYFTNNQKTFTGVDIDLIRAISRGLGLKPHITNLTFNGLIPALIDGRLNTIISGIGDFTDREKQGNFVDYLRTDPEVVVPKADASQFTSLLSMCGKTMAVQSGSVEVTATQDESKRCKAAGKPPIKMMLFEEDSAALLAQESGRAEMHTTDGPIAHEEAATIDGGRRFVVKFPNFLKTPLEYGIITAKPDLGLARAIQAELNVLIKNGTYRQILSRYHVEPLAIPSATINAAKVSSTSIQ